MSALICAFGDPARPSNGTPLLAVLSTRECPNPEVLERPHHGKTTEQCARCLIAYAKEHEPVKNGCWGPIRSLGENLRR